MSGVKGRSGRKPRADELKIAELADLSINWAIDNWSKLSKDQKLRIVMNVATKYITQTVETDSTVYLQVIDELTESNPSTIRGIIEMLREGSSKNRSVLAN